MNNFNGLGRAPNYTNAFLVSFGVLIFMALIALWAMLGYPLALLSGWSADRLMVWREGRRAE